jgi:hypothetical protein
MKSNTRLFLVVALALSVNASCKSCKKDDGDTAAGADGGGAHHKGVDSRPAPAMPAPGTDADNKRLAALALATKIDGDLATFKHDEKTLDPALAGANKKAEVWWIEASPEQPKKVIVKELDASGNVQSQTDMYFDEKAMLTYAKAPDGHFVFHNESLALWLDPEQRIKHGVKPQDAGLRANALKKEMSAALTTFKLR